MAATTIDRSPATLDAVPNPVAWDGRPEAVGQSREWITGLLRQAGLHGMVDDAALVVSELVTNSASWSQSRGGELSIRGSALLRPRFLTVSIRDWGPLSRRLQRRLKGDERDGGLGLKVVRSISHGYERMFVRDSENWTSVAQIALVTLKLPRPG